MSLARTMARTAQRAGSTVRQALRGILQRLDATQALPGAQVTGLDGEQLQVELMQHYGLATAPLSGAEVIVLPLGGSSAHGVIIASVDGRYRIQLKPGEVALHTDEGDHIYLQRGRVIEVVTETLLIKAGTKMRIETPEIEATGNVTAEGEVSDGVRAMSADRAIYNSHTHSGVQPGPGDTAKPNQEQ
ncbi:phage baseplate assembly protein V [Stenotrophomonas sp. B1-1]|uniref:phage baseplate assembly protein V n=1 Tax=Stenotrophomonas sp. B1-1 TaxID=2710648 RepID=UPI0019683A24|nr:phage baseplate assembly protein V [Stenotrophomonas sp. B1-1]